MGLFDRVYAQLDNAVDVRTIGDAAAKIEAKLRADATTKRGNIPQFSPGPKGHPGGDVTIVATYSSTTINVTGPAWVMAKAVALGQVEEWEEIVRGEVTRKRR